MQLLDFTSPNGTLSQWNLLLGDNGAGKTTVLQCLSEIFARVSKIPAAQELPQGGWRFVAHETTQVPYARVGCEKFSLRFSMVTDIKLGQLSKNHDFTELEVHSHKGKSGYNESITSLLLCGYGAFRRFGNTKLGAELNPDPCITLFNDDEPLLNVEEWLLRSDYAATKSKDAKARLRLEHITKLLIKLLPEVEEIRIPPNGPAIPIPEAKTPDGFVPVRSLSTGYRATMAWVTDFAARMLDRYPDSATPFAEPAVVLVDQIDTHLHPKWQRPLVQDLSSCFPATQFIVTAHSPLMVLAMPEANVAVLRRDGDHTVIHNNPENVRGWRVDQVLASALFEEQPTRDTTTHVKLEERRKLLTR